MRIALITGPCQPGRCGVGDYARCLAEALTRAGAHVEVVDDGDWSLMELPSLIRLARRSQADILHLQYPSSGFAHKLGPHALSVTVPSVVTIHEASRAHLLRRLSLYPFGLRTAHLVFTSAEERAFAVRWAPWITGKSSVIPIGSNIEARPATGQRNSREIIYFGLVMPRKGLEEVLALAALLKGDGRDLSLRIVGSHRPEHTAYAAELRRRSEGLPVRWEQDLNKGDVGQRLAGHWIAYLPFPDGASDRRGSLKAALASGMAVVTTRGRETPAELESVVEFISSPAEALAVIQRFVEDPALLRAMGERAREYAARFSWEVIAQRHLSIYQNLCPEGFD